MPKQAKKYKQSSDLFDRRTHYTLDDAVGFLKKMPLRKFDETVELHLRTGADVRHADQQVRGVTVLPHGVGKPVKVMVFATEYLTAILAQPVFRSVRVQLFAHLQRLPMSY